MNTDLKKAIIGLIHNLSVKSYNRTRVNDAIDKIVESSGGGGSDDSIAIFEVEDENTYSITFKLLAGKPKINDNGYLEAIFIDKWYGGNYICEIGNNQMIVDYSYVSVDMIFHSKRLKCNEFNISDFINLNVGESIVITGVPITITTSVGTSRISLSKTTPTNLSHASYVVNVFNIVDYTLCMVINNYSHIKVGYITEINNSENYFVIRFDNEFCKFSFDAPHGNIETITFVEVVTP